MYCCRVEKGGIELSLRYSVAIIDDNKLLYKNYKAVIDEYLSENGFDADVEHIPSEQDFDDFPLDKPSLFLVDLKFGQVDKGQIFIEKIRGDYLTDVLFYSSDHDAIDKYRSELGSQGIFFAERDELNDEVEPLLEKMLCKMIARSNAPRATRGLVMECVAELDDKIKEKIILLLDKLPEDHREKYYKDVIRIIKSSSDGRLNKLQQFFDVPFAEKRQNILSSGISLDFSVPDLIENIRITDSSKNLNFLLSLYCLHYGKNDLYEQIKQYEKLLQKRNILAHVSQVKEGDTYIFKSRDSGSPDYVLTDEECLMLRKTILALSDLLTHIN